MNISRDIRFFMALIFGIFRRLVPRSRSGPPVIAIIQLSKMGDLVCTTPMFRAVKKSFPNSRLIVVCRGAGTGILEGNTDIDELVRFDHLGFWGTVKQLRRARCSFGTVPSPDFNALAALLIAGIPHISATRVVGGYCPQETVFYKILRWLVCPVDNRIGSYVPREYLRLLEPAGIRSDDTTKHLAFSASADAHVMEWLRHEGITDDIRLIGIALAAGNRIKVWPAERFAKVAEHIAAYPNTRVIILTGPGEQADGARFRAALPDHVHVLDAAGILGLDALKALIAKLKLFISVDTGPIYIAEAFGVPTIDIVGPMDEREQPPRGPSHISVVPPAPRIPVLHIMNASIYDEASAREQVLSITVQAVLDAVHKIMRP